MESKKMLRKTILKKRATLSDEEQLLKGETIFNHLISMPEVLNASTIASFVDFNGEVDTRRFNQWCLDQGKKLVLPRIDMKSKVMTLHYVHNLDALVISDYGIEEPAPDQHVLTDISELDVVITPGVGFDLKGYRLGYGGGYYDRLFSKLSQSTPKIAIAFELQITEEIPIAEYDCPVTHLITEIGVRQF